MIKALINRKQSGVYYFVDGKKIFGVPVGLTGNVSGLTGDVSGLRGNVSSGLSGNVSSGLTGNVSGLLGDVSGLTGNVSGLLGDASGLMGNVSDCELSDKDRANGVDVRLLIAATETVVTWV